MDILHAQEMQQLDEYAIQHIGIPQCVLMERAALGVFECMKEKNLLSSSNVLVLSGPGNCGGDGLALARVLLDRGIKADVYLVKDLEGCKESVQSQAGYFKAFGGRILSDLPDPDHNRYTVFVDAIFGIGLNREVSGKYLDCIRWLNAASGKEDGKADRTTDGKTGNETGNETGKNDENRKIIISIDIPSGVHTDTGVVLGDAVKADFTVTFSYLKPGLLLPPGRECTGEVVLSSIGIDSLCVPGMEKNAYCLTENDELKKRDPAGNKGTFHRILVVAGSKDMCGAAILSATAAFRSGAGLVEVYTHEDNRTAMLSALPEAIVHTYADVPSEEELRDMTKRADSVVFGPGIARNEASLRLAEFLLKYCEKPMVIDAGGISLMAEGEAGTGLKNLLKERAKQYPTILTPHPGELSAFTGRSKAELLGDYEKSVKETAGEYGVILVGKGATTLVSDGKKVCFNRTGNDGMATGGSGDVLSGMVGCLAVNEETPFEGVCLAVYRHGLAGDFAAKEWGNRSLLAADLWKGILR